MGAWRMVVATERIMVPFAGEGAGAGALTWAQQGVHWVIERTGRTLNIGGVVPLPEGTPVTQLAHELSFIVSRHPSLRTRYHFPADAPPWQVVEAAGEIPLEIFDVADDADPAAAAEAVRLQSEYAPFNHP